MKNHMCLSLYNVSLLKIIAPLGVASANQQVLLLHLPILTGSFKHDEKIPLASFNIYSLL